ncbi:precorrin-2 dehydrogenase/sirohydrochlorin ferrochelatase family protein [Chondromyces apiculatus]|uniref:precorrin-2 dehydrogenase n=1 Tax=Chondromyces apiculatus DSM 436 TaxID=1192034 RepID=A0A017SXI0_9BACT|nr:NAD(P)-dependent oxidoreductase [Chondromyces apiculatus]EYF01330.1 siroheme synthase [Chondromyces apiculatus DSM 436]
MRLFPIALDLNGRSALVIGAHGEAPHTIQRLLAAGARVTVLAPPGLAASDTTTRDAETRDKETPDVAPSRAEAPDIDPAILAAADAARLTLHRRPFQDSDLEGQAIVFLAPLDDALSRRLHRDLSAAGRLVCTLDRPEVSTFSNMAVAEVPGLTMTFSTHGASPATARRIREDLTALFSDPRFARYLDALHRARAALPRGEARMARMRAAVQGFAIEARLRFPSWFDPTEPTPD